MSAVSLTPEVTGLLTAPGTRITVLTGAGISAESGIPTFRGPEGYWTSGSRVYTPMQLATRAMFSRDPVTVWQWYLQRLVACSAARPNAGHRALVEMERFLGERFTLITQNIDNLHLRAGNTQERTLQIHGNVTLTRCSRACSRELEPLPAGLSGRGPGPPLGEDELNRLRCRRCGAWLRPHVLWFDEYYDEEWFRAETALRVAGESDLLIVAGTSGATTLPNHICAIHLERGRPLIDINLEQSPFSRLAADSPGGQFIRQSCSDALTGLWQSLDQA